MATDYSHELRNLAATLDEAKQEINLARQQSTKRQHLYVRGRRSAVQAARAVVAAVDAGFYDIWPPGVWILSSMRNPDDPNRQPATIQSGDFKAQLHSMKVGSGCNPDGSLPDDTAFALWLQSISPFMRSKRLTSKADAGAFDFPAVKTDEQGRILGRNSKPLEHIVTIDPETGEPAGWKLNGPAAHVTDDYDDVDALEHLRCQAADWADACNIAADAIRDESDAAELRAAQYAMVFFPSRDNPGVKPWPEWRSSCWPREKLDPTSVLAWLDYYTAAHGPLTLMGGLRAHNAKRYNAAGQRQWLTDDAWTLATKLARECGFPDPPAKPAIASTIEELRDQLIGLRRWIAGEMPKKCRAEPEQTLDWFQLQNDASYILDLLASNPDRHDTDLLIVAVGRIEQLLNPKRLPFSDRERHSFGGDAELCRGWRKIRRAVDSLIEALDLKPICEGRGVGWRVVDESALPSLPSPIPSEWIADLGHGVRIFRQRLEQQPAWAQDKSDRDAVHTLNRAAAWLQAKFLERGTLQNMTACDRNGKREATVHFAPVTLSEFHDWLLSIGAPVAATVDECRSRGWIDLMGGGHHAAKRPTHYWIRPEVCQEIDSSVVKPSVPNKRTPWFVSLARDALNEGYRVVSSRLNSVLREKAPGVLIDAEPVRQGDSLRHAAEQLRQALPGLRTLRQLPASDSHIAAWTVGFINSTNNARMDLLASSLTGNIEEEMTFHCDFLRESRTHWAPEIWADCIKAPVESLHAENLRMLDEIAAESALHRTGQSNQESPTETPAVLQPAPAVKLKRSTAKNEAQSKIVPALLHHHKYDDGGCLNLEPIGVRQLARLAGVRESTVSEFFKKRFGGWNAYRVKCRDAGCLADSLKVLNGDFSPVDLYGRSPPGERDRDDDE